jgi:ATP-dependent helicase HrpB
VFSPRHLPADLSSIDLPVKEALPALKASLATQTTVVLSAPAGAGKSTLLPLALIDEPWLEKKKIVMLEPRRLAARTISSRMAFLNGDDTGDTVGYRIRFEKKISNTTRIEVVTEGILTRMLHSDNALEAYGLVIFDEFHERSLHADLALALCREAQQVLRPDLRILIMSATLDIPGLSALLKAPVIESKGRHYPVSIFYGNDADETLLPELTARVVASAVKEHIGDALVFLPGEGEIRKCESLLQGQLDDVLVYPLYGQLSPAEQQRAIMPDRHGRRRVVLATSIAETSLTIEGVRIVVDCGFGRTSRFDPRSGLTKLQTHRISRDSADQRAGRAGRLSAGVCYRMWTQATHSRLQENRVPEILEADLAPLMLDMAAWGVSDIGSLTWLTQPPKASVSQAGDLLDLLGAVENGKITPHGREIHRLPCHPRIAHMLIMAKDVKAKQLGTDVAAVLEERDPLPREAGIDINLRVEALRRARRSNNIGRFVRIEKAAAQYRNILAVDVDNAAYDPHDAGLLLAYAYPERIASARPGNNAQFQLSNGRLAMAGHQDDLAHEQWLVAANLDQRDGMGKIFLAAPINPKDLLPMVKEQEVVTWDTRRGGLVSNRELRLGGIVLQSRPLEKPDQQLVEKALFAAIANEGESLLDLDENFEQLRNRISSLVNWNGDEGWPRVDTSSLMSDPAWIAPYLSGVKKPEDMKRIDAAAALHNSLPWEKQQELDRLAPPYIAAPSGSKIKLQYFPNGATPVLAVRLQEVFGLADTPAVNNNKIPLVLHLLSPGYKPVQVTSDLRSFWNNLYHEVKRELQRRYPKHSWPDDPWSAKAVAKGRSQK